MNQEISLLSKLRHENIVQYIGTETVQYSTILHLCLNVVLVCIVACMDWVGSDCGIDNFMQLDDRLYIYLEYVSGGSIHKLLQEYGAFREPVVRNYTRQILSGLAYLHYKNTVHR